MNTIKNIIFIGKILICTLLLYHMNAYGQGVYADNGGYIDSVFTEEEENILDQVTIENIELPYYSINLLGRLYHTPLRKLSDGVVVIVHDTLGTYNADIVERLQEYLAVNDYNSLAITLSLSVDKRRQYFNCGVPHYHKHSDALFELQAWYKYLKNRGVKAFTLLGHGRGANQVAWFANDYYSDDLAAVIMLAPMVFIPEQEAKQYRNNHKKDLDLVYYNATKTPNELMPLTGFLGCDDATVLGASFMSYYGNDLRKNTPYLLPHLKTNNLVIVAAKDTVYPEVDVLIDDMVIDLTLNNKTLQAPLHVIKIDEAEHDFSDVNLDEAVINILEFLNGKMEHITYFKHTEPRTID